MVLGIRYLTGYCVARDLTKQQAEWPPHPARLFMALAATHFETGADPTERQALLWLESQPPPTMFASEANSRTVVETYVPVNDQTGGIFKRKRQSRSFPVIRPHRDSVYLFWDADPEAHLRRAMEQLCSKVSRIGHSSSLTQVWLGDDSIKPEGLAEEGLWMPSKSEVTSRLRIPEEGLLHYLERMFNGAVIQDYLRLQDELLSVKGKAKAALKKQIDERFGDEAPFASRPVVKAWSGYAYIERHTSVKMGEPVSGPFDPEFIVLSKFEGASLGLETTLQITAALRSVVLSTCPKPQPEWVTGHAETGAPSKHPHLAFFPLPFVGREYADGHILGMGIAIPKELVGESRPVAQALRDCLGPMFFDRDGSERRIKLWNKNRRDEKIWQWTLERELRPDPPESLKQSKWIGPSRHWSSVTPVVLHHFPAKNNIGDVERIVREAFKSALLPEPESVHVGPISAHQGAGSIREIPAFDEGPGLTRYQTHVRVTFPCEVIGPVLVGRGRFRGYGLFRPSRPSAGVQ